MHISYRAAHAHLIYGCVCPSHLGLRMRISFRAAHAHAHLILGCACAFYLGLRVRISFGAAHLILGCACASHLGLRMRILFMTAHAHLILSCAFAFHCGVNAPLIILGTPYHTNQPSKFVQKIAKHALLKLLKSHLLACYPTHTPVKGVKFNYKH